jgi:hypothetical protein
MMMMMVMVEDLPGKVLYTGKPKDKSIFLLLEKIHLRVLRFLRPKYHEKERNGPLSVCVCPLYF